MMFARFVSIQERIAKLRIYSGTKTSKGGREVYKEIAYIGKKYEFAIGPKISGSKLIAYICFHLIGIQKH